VAWIVTWPSTPDRGVETADNGPAEAGSVVVVDVAGISVVVVVARMPWLGRDAVLGEHAAAPTASVNPTRIAFVRLRIPGLSHGTL